MVEDSLQGRELLADERVLGISALSSHEGGHEE